MGKRSEEPDQHQRYIIAVLVGSVPVLLAAHHYLGAGYLYTGDFMSNLIPAVYTRQELLAGDILLRTDKFFEPGRSLYHNPLFKIFYPPAWLLFLPGVPLAIASKLLYAGHILAIGAIAYLHADQDFEWYVAVPFALLFVFILYSHFGQAEKVFGWPLIVLLTWRLTPNRLTNAPNRSGWLVGMSAGALLLTGANYLFIYAGILAGFVGLLWADRTFITRAVTGSLIGVPKFVASILPVLLSGPDRPARGYEMGVLDVFEALSGFPHLFGSLVTVRFGAQYVLGFPVVILAVVGWYRLATRAAGRLRRWFYGVTLAGVFGIALATGSHLVYALPSMGIHRTAKRATLLVALVCLLFAWAAIREVDTGAYTMPDVDVTLVPDGDGTGSQHEQCATLINTDVLVTRHRVLAVVAVALLLSAQLGAVVMVQGHLKHHSGDRVTDATAIATDLKDQGCSSVWIDSTPIWAYEQENFFDSTQLAFAIAREGMALRAFHYGAIGQEWQVRESNGNLSFDVLVTSTKLPANGTIQLSESDGAYPAGEPVAVSRFNYLDSYRYSAAFGTRTLYAYSAQNECQSPIV